MAKFEEEKVINALHPEKAEVGKKYWYSDSLILLKKYVEENDNIKCIGKLEYVEDTRDICIFHIVEECGWDFLYPYEEPPKKKMTNLQLMEWLAKGNGVYKNQGGYVYSSYGEQIELLDEEVDKIIPIRPFGQTEWVEPTVDIYERDCRGGKE